MSSSVTALQIDGTTVSRLVSAGVNNILPHPRAPRAPRYPTVPPHRTRLYYQWFAGHIILHTPHTPLSHTHTTHAHHSHRTHTTLAHTHTTHTHHTLTHTHTTHTPAPLLGCLRCEEICLLTSQPVSSLKCRHLSKRSLLKVMSSVRGAMRD